MKKRWKILFLICTALSFSGCRKIQVQPPVVVTQVQLQWDGDGEKICRIYTEEGQIRTVLDCLRLQKSRGTATVDPERLVGDVFEITICLSDGKRHIYRYRGGRYLSRDSHPWQLVDPGHGEALYNLLWKFL